MRRLIRQANLPIILLASPEDSDYLVTGLAENGRARVPSEGSAITAEGALSIWVEIRSRDDSAVIHVLLVVLGCVANQI